MKSLKQNNSLLYIQLVSVFGNDRETALVVVTGANLHFQVGTPDCLADHQDPMFMELPNPVGPSEGSLEAAVSHLGHKNDEP